MHRSNKFRLIGEFRMILLPIEFAAKWLS
jgi:hypothetical protein